MKNKRNAYTLIDTLIAITLLLIVATYAICTVTDSRNPDYYTKLDSRELTLWLGQKMAMADATGASFTLTYYSDKLRFVWTSGEHYAQEDYFRPSKCKLSSATKGGCVYSGQWHTMTPAVTYSLTYGTSVRKVIISGQGYLH